jgi:hypothetical protein
VAEPTVAGEKVTPTVQLAPAATPAPQVLLATANGPLTPLTATLLTVSVVFRRFVSVIMRVEFVASTTLPKLKLVGENVTGALPLPESVTVCVPALSVIVTLPEAAPTTVGANDTWMVHDAAGAIGPLQLLVWLNGAVATTFERVNRRTLTGVTQMSREMRRKRRFEVSYQCHTNCDEWWQKVNKDRKEKVNLTMPI